tara:strand:+ start:592 stop:1080 length:489 start_codon:yes stop_codon:yes gene_type:complete
LKFGLTGDTHNNLTNIASICKIFNDSNVDFVVHTGDITLPKSLLAFRSLEVPLIGVFGNNDQGDINDLKRICIEYGFDFSENFKELDLNGKKAFIVHDPKDIQEKFYGKNNIILHGHTHRLRNEVIKQTFIFNPGECAGMMKGKNSVGIIDSDHLKMNVINF